MKVKIVVVVLFFLSISLSFAKPGEPLKCVDATCSNESGKKFNGSCEPTGLFKFSKLPDGKYKATISTVLSDGKTKKPIEFSFEVKTAREAGSGMATGKRDAGSGMATGKRQHKPFVITKEIDAYKLSCTIDEDTATGAIIEK